MRGQPSLPAGVVGGHRSFGSVRRHSLSDRRARAWCVSLLYVTLRRVTSLLFRHRSVLRASRCAVAERVSSRFSRTRNVRNSRASRRDRFARVDRCVILSVFVLRIRVYTYRVKRFCAPNSAKGSSLIWSDAAPEKERREERDAVHTSPTSRSILPR